MNIEEIPQIITAIQESKARSTIATSSHTARTMLYSNSINRASSADSADTNQSSKTMTAQDILERAHNCCEFCGIPNYTVRDNGSRVVLTIAHLDHTPENCDPSNLRALCQKCHNSYDAPHRAETRKARRG